MSTWRTLLVLYSAVWIHVGDASAASVFVRWEINFLTDPLAVRFSDGAGSFFEANHRADASLSAGRFLTYAASTAVDPASETSSGIGDALYFTNQNPFPVTIWAGLLSAHVEGTYAIVPVGGAVVTGTDTVVELGVTTSGTQGVSLSAGFTHTLRADGLPANDQNVFTPSTLGGATVVVAQATPAGLEVDLSMPTFTLPAGETMAVSFDVTLTSLPGSTADYFSSGGARLSLELPPGIALANDAAGPLDWVTVPEPGQTAMLVAGLIALAGAARRHPMLRQQA